MANVSLSLEGKESVDITSRDLRRSFPFKNRAVTKITLYIGLAPYVRGSENELTL
jgi:hypothetical protein